MSSRTESAAALGRLAASRLVATPPARETGAARNAGDNAADAAGRSRATGGKMRIEPMAASHIAAVARLHVMRLSRDFSGWAGRQIMALFYRELIRSQTPPPAFVALVDERVVGYAVAVADARALKRRLALRWGWWLALLGLVQFVVRPLALIGRFWRRLRQPRARRPPDWVDPLERCCPAPRVEFRGIVVDPDAHVPGAALALMRVRLAWAKAAGYRSIYFKIEPDNEASLRLSQWAGAVAVPNDEPGRMLRFYKVIT